MKMTIRLKRVLSVLSKYRAPQHTRTKRKYEQQITNKNATPAGRFFARNICCCFVSEF